MTKKKSKNKNKLISILIGLVFITLGLVFAFIYLQNPKTPDIEVTPSPSPTKDIASNLPSPTNSATHEPINPSPSPSPSQVNPSQPPVSSYLIDSFQDLEDYLNYLLNKNEGMYGLSFLNLNTDEYLGINEIDFYVAASSTKVPFVMYIYKMVEEGKMSFDTLVEYTEDDTEAGTGIIIYEEYGKEFTILELTDYAILYSDNCAINMLMRIAGEWNMVNYMNKLGAKVDYINNRWKTCPYDLLLYFQELYRKYEENPSFYERFIETLSTNSVAYGVSSRSILPKDVQVGLKTGINYNLPTYNETSIVFAKNTYILSYCSSKIVMEESFDVFRDLSLTIYEFVENGQVYVDWEGL